jgi:ribonucleoside-diphosphate reductase alpha chain
MDAAFRFTGNGARGLTVERRWTTPGVHPYDEVSWETRRASITNEAGTVVFEQDGVEVPIFWSQLATNVVVSKYFRGHIGTPQRERSVRQLIDRVVGTIAGWAATQHYFASDADLATFQAELTHLLLHQKMSFNSPVWFNVGVEPRPQSSACFINSVEDSMSSIMDLAKTEAMLFKYGSGAGVNLSPIRGSKERMSGGGIASGPVSFMKGFDAFAGVVKSGGKTRRAAKMVILDADHPDILDFIDSKANEERKAWALIEQGYDPSFTGEAYGSVFFQNANHSVRATDAFMTAVERDADWTTHEVTTGELAGTHKARQIFRRMAEAAWICGDPGIQYDTTINDWNPVANTARQYATNPCSEFSFINDTSCFAPETRISTPDGLRAVEELFRAQELGQQVMVTTDLHSEADHRRITAHRPAQVTRVGERPVFRMRLADGREIRATADHRFLTSQGQWKELGELQVGSDRIAIREAGNPVSYRSDPADVRRWRMLGWLTGDGVFSKDTAALVFGPQERATAAWMEMEFQTLVQEARSRTATAEAVEVELSRGALLDADGIHLPARGKASHVSTAASGVLQISSKSAPVIRMLEDSYGFRQATATQKDVPSEVHRVADDLKVAYLQGLFSADGCIGEWDANPVVMLASSSRSLLRSVQLMLADLGITSRMTWSYPNGRPNPQGQLHISNQQARAFLSIVGFACSEANGARAAEILASPFLGARKNPRAPRVVSIEPDGVETVYDITEPVTHSIIAEGLVAHNCNLASLNLMKFVDADGEFDAEAFGHASRLTITAQEIIVDNASYPTARIEENSHRFRPLGLGYANLGALLMSRGLAYDSDEGRAYAAAITAIMTGEAYRQSAIIARDHGGPFNDYAVNEEPFLRVIRKHRDAAQSIATTHLPEPLVQAAWRAWDEALELGERHGYRNAQTSLLAPTGTIAFMMDCDTTGIEPDIALIKYKKLVGEGFLKIVNGTVPVALRRLGYSPDETEAIVAYIDERETIEGAPGLRPDHLTVFDCAFKPVNGERSIHHMGHLRMMSAAQPFLSGAISKTVNMPEQATPEDIADVYLQGWKLGLKAIAIYRDGSKRSQPLSTGRKPGADTGALAEAEDLDAPVEPKPYRRRLPDERRAVTHKFQVAGHEGYITVGLYPDGQPGEIFLKMAKEGSTVSGLMDTLATMTSIALQYGVPLRDLVSKFAHVRFEPSGFTGNPEVPIAKSIVDYIFRWMGSRFLAKDDRDALGILGGAVVAEPPSATLPHESPVDLAAGIADSTAAEPPPAPSTSSGGEGGDRPKPAVSASTAQARPSGENARNGARNGNGDGPGNAAVLTTLGAGQRLAFSVSADSPSCMDCGSIMVRNGSCYKCLNCGATSGCS